MKAIIPKQTADNSETKELFLLYNYRFKPRETGTGCSGCRSRVYNRLLKYYNEIGE
jgi:hypothetical protein